MSRHWWCSCDPTRGQSCRLCDGTADDERDPNYFRARPSGHQASEPGGPHLDEGDVA